MITTLSGKFFYFVCLSAYLISAGLAFGAEQICESTVVAHIPKVVVFGKGEDSETALMQARSECLDVPRVDSCEEVGIDCLEGSMIWNCPEKKAVFNAVREFNDFASKPHTADRKALRKCDRATAAGWRDCKVVTNTCSDGGVDDDEENFNVWR